MEQLIEVAQDWDPLLEAQGAHWWHIALAAAVLCCTGAAAPEAAAYVFPDQMARYHRELGGGPGHCLHGTPYASEREFPKASQVTYDDRASERMTVTPIDKTYQPLILDHAVRGRLHRLTPANVKSSQILESHGC